MGGLRNGAVAVSLLSALGLAGAARGDIYLYRDERGVIHFTNVPSHNGFRPIIRENRTPLEGAALPDPLEEVISAASERHGVDPRLVRAVIKVESDFNSLAISRKGARGLMQLMPETARLHNVANVYDPVENIEAGVRHLRLLLDRYRGDLELALAGYNAGINAVEKYRGVPPYRETRDYIQRVLRYFTSYQAR